MFQSSCGRHALSHQTSFWRTTWSTSRHKQASTTTAVRPDLARADQDCIGPADPISRMRPIHFHVPPNETPLQAAYRTARDDTQGWNQTYWLHHNASFEKEKQAFISSKLTEKYKDSDLLGDSQQRANLTAEEMAEFYKHFLDSNYERHMQYNKDWYSRCLVNLRLALKVWLQQLRTP